MLRNKIEEMSEINTNGSTFFARIIMIKKFDVTFNPTEQNKKK